MKQTILFIAISAMLASCTQKSFTISGIINNPEANGKKIILYENRSKDTLAVAEIKDNKFVLTGAVEGQKLCTIQYSLGDNKKSHSSTIILENAKFSIDTSFIVTGTELQNKYTDYRIKYRALTKERNAAIKALREDNSLDPVTKGSKETTLSIKYDSLWDELIIETITATPNTLITTYLLPYISDKKKFVIVYEASPDFIKEDPRCKEKYLKYNSYLTHDVGCMFEDFTIERGNLDGTTAKLSDYVGKGKYILLDFWSSWCGPCQAEIKYIKEVYEKYHGDKFDVVSIGVWEKKREDTIEKAKEHNIPWNQIVNAQSIPTTMYGITGIPHLILFAPDGTIVARGLRGWNGELQKTIAEYLTK